MKIAIVHEWLVDYAGSERVLEELISMFPDADLFSVVDFLSDSQRGFLLGKKAKTSFIQKLPFSKAKFRHYLPLMPIAVEQFDLSNYDLVISSSHAVAKGVITGPNQMHISYVHSPMRYAWDLQHQYLLESGLNKGMKGLIVKWMLHKMRLWDYRTANGVDQFIANSKFIARRICKVYGKESRVIYPPVNIEAFPFSNEKEDYYLTVSRMVPYKKLDLIVEAFTLMPEKKLIVIGDGPEFKKIKSKSGRNVELLGYRSNEEVKTYMQNARAFVFAAEEDFGIVSVEAQSCGTPVIAYGKGGTIETIRGLETNDPTGVLFYEQTVDSLIAAVKLFEVQNRIFPEACRRNSLRFTKQRFREEFRQLVNEKINPKSEFERR